MESKDSNGGSLYDTTCDDSMTKGNRIGESCSDQFCIEDHVGKIDTPLDKEYAYNRGKDCELWEASKSISYGNKYSALKAIDLLFIENEGAKALLHELEGDRSLLADPIKTNGVDELRTVLMLSQVSGKRFSFHSIRSMINPKNV